MAVSKNTAREMNSQDNFDRFREWNEIDKDFLS